jgi:hypothetical protein
MPAAKLITLRELKLAPATCAAFKQPNATSPSMTPCWHEQWSWPDGKAGIPRTTAGFTEAERHILWLRASLGKHPITGRTERELLLRRTELAITHGDTVTNLCNRILKFH